MRRLGAQERGGRALKAQERAGRQILGYCPLAPPGVKAKFSYPTKSAAKRALKHANKKTSDVTPGRQRLTNAYQCRCGHWHLTSQTEA